jgi:serine/threonine protein kinase
MEIFCPNPLCTDRQQSIRAEICTQCHTPLKIAERYLLTEIVRTSPEHINGPQYYWYELFAATSIGEDGNLNSTACRIVKLLAVKEGFAGTEDVINKAHRRFEQEFQLLQAGIPGVCKSYALLAVPRGDGSSVRAIVMERVLGENLEEYLQNRGAIDSQRALRWFHQLLNILQKLHRQGIQHRDIKPSNIIVTGQGLQEQLTLIDLGIAKVPTHTPKTTTLQGSLGYMDPLYISGQRAYRNDSDLYSLGMTMLRLLTGENPEVLGTRHWSEFVQHPPLQPELLKTIDRAIAMDPNRRFRSATQCQRYLQVHSHSYWLKKLQPIGWGILGGAIFPGIIYYELLLLKPSVVALHPICNIKGINCGEESFTIRGDREGNAYQSITQKFQLLSSRKSNDRQEAIDNLSRLWKDYRDPEILIYLNNAKLWVGQSKVYTILVAVPGSDKSDSTLFNIDKSFLHGIAKAQENFNNNPKNKDWKLHVAIIRDELVQPTSPKESEEVRPPTPETIREIAKTIDDNFVGVIGHYSSKNTFKVLFHYAQNGIFVLSPSASRGDLPAADVTADSLEYFARVVSSTKDASHKMVQELEFLARQNGDCGIEIQMISEPADSFSKSFADEFQNDVQSINALIIRQHFQICSDTCNDFKTPKIVDPIKLKPMTIDEIANHLQNPLKPKAENLTCRPKRAIALLPGAYTMTNQSDNMERIAKKIPPGTILVGHSTINDQNFLNYLGKNPELAKNTYITIPWHPLGLISHNTFGKFVAAKSFVNSILTDMKEPWDIQNVNWRLITAADATQAYIAAIQLKQQPKNANRTFRDIIRDPQFRVSDGVSESLAFDGFNRSGLQMATVVKPLPYCQFPQKVATVPLDYRDPQAPDRPALCYRQLQEIPSN